MTRLSSFVLLAALALSACASEPTDAPAETEPVAASETPDSGAEMGDASVVVGEEPAAEAEILPVSAAIAQSETLQGETVAVEGTVSKVCSVKGCWMTLTAENGETFRVIVPKDEAGEYVFTFPMDATGATAQIVGQFAVETEDVETQRHLAEDGGASEEEVQAITEPKTTYVLTAQGARLSRA